MGKVTVETRPLTLSLKKGIDETIARKTVVLLEKQAGENMSSTGGSLGRKVDGSKVTLKQSGDLWREVDYRETPEGCKVELRKPYASFVFARYEAETLSPKYQAQLEKQNATLIEGGVILTEGDEVKVVE